MGREYRSDSDEETYVFETRQDPDGRMVRVTKTPAGIVLGEDFYRLDRLVERLDYDGCTGAVVSRAVYEFDDQRKPLRTTIFDADGDVVTIQERGLPPVVGEFYRGEDRFGIYPKKKGNS